VEGEQALAERLAGLVLRNHHGEAELLERVAHGAGVVDGLLQLGNVLVVVVADHQRDALFGGSGCGECQQYPRSARRRNQSAKPTLHRIPRKQVWYWDRIIYGPYKTSHAIVGWPLPTVQCIATIACLNRFYRQMMVWPSF